MRQALIVRNGTSGRFTPIAECLAQAGWSGAVINPPVGTDIEGWKNVRWSARRAPNPSHYPPAAKFEEGIRCAVAAAEQAARLKADGFVPDVIIGHPAWGEMLLLPEVWPGVPQIQIGEYYYQTKGADTDFDPASAATSIEQKAAVRAQNAMLAMSYAEAAAIVAPTPFQASLIPATFHPKLRTIHEGVDTRKTCRKPRADIRLPNGTLIPPGAPVVSFVNRRFEPMRGFDVFMRALPKFLSLAPTAHVVLVGADEPRHTYGRRPRDAACWREAMLAEVGSQLPEGRVHFEPPMPYDRLVALLSNVTAHVYLTYPFVLSWSLLDAMACETLVVASDTPPVRDVMAHERDGLLVDFFDTDGLARTLAAVCADPARYDPLRRAARRTILERYDRAAICMPAWHRLVEEVVAAAA